MSVHCTFGELPTKAFGPISSDMVWLYPLFFFEFSPIWPYDLMFMFAITSNEKFGNSVKSIRRISSWNVSFHFN